MLVLDSHDKTQQVRHLVNADVRYDFGEQNQSSARLPCNCVQGNYPFNLKLSLIKWVHSDAPSSVSYLFLQWI